MKGQCDCLLRQAFRAIKDSAMETPELAATRSVLIHTQHGANLIIADFMPRTAVIATNAINPHVWQTRVCRACDSSNNGAISQVANKLRCFGTYYESITVQSHHCMVCPNRIHVKDSAGRVGWGGVYKH